ATYHECDLLVVEALRRGLMDDLEPGAMATMASAFTFEGRRGPKGAHNRGSGAPLEPWFPSPLVGKRWGDLEHIATALNLAEQAVGLPSTRYPDEGFFAASYGWATGEDLSEIIAAEEMTGGDFVRNIRQLMDLLRGIGVVARDEATATSAKQAADSLFRGVIAASSVLVDDKISKPSHAASLPGPMERAAGPGTPAADHRSS
ncbi:MAG: hypothetical protein ACRDRT_13700, partial [Pseudonocardiaceae bacterium]